MMAIAQSAYANEAHPISPDVFGVLGGKVSALVRPTEDPPEPEPKKKGLLGRLFH